MYDAKVIEQFAIKMYGKAARLTAASAVGGFFAGLVAARMVDGAGGGVLDLGLVSYLIFGALFAAIGYAVGEYQAFKLRFKAQSALCQLEQEKHLRALVASSKVQPQPLLTAVVPANANAA